MTRRSSDGLRSKEKSEQSGCEDGDRGRGLQAMRVVEGVGRKHMVCGWFFYSLEDSKIKESLNPPTFFIMEMEVMEDTTITMVAAVVRMTKLRRRMAELGK